MLYRDWEDEPVTIFSVCKSAFHEVCELMFCPLTTIASRQASRHIVDSETHTVIRRLENLMWLPDWESRSHQPKKRRQEMTTKACGYRKHTPIVSEKQRKLFGAVAGGASTKAIGLSKAEAKRHLKEVKGKKLPEKARR